MTSKSNINPQSRGFYYAPTGNDAFAGNSIEVPKLTMGAAITAAENLVPPPSTSATASIEASQGGVFTESITLSDSILFVGENVTFVNSDPITCSLGSFARFAVTAIINNAVSGTCVDVNARTAVGINSDFIAADGASGIAINLRGSLNSIFGTISQMRIGGASGTGISMTGTSPDPVDININSVILGNTNTIFMDYNPSSGSDRMVVNASSVINGSTSTTAFRSRNGHLVVESAGIIEADTALYVESGAELTVDAALVNGNIIVESGGILNATIIRHNGTIIALGDINGNIDGTDYGIYVDGSSNFVSFFRRGIISPTFQDAGRLTLDMAVYKLDDVLASYQQTALGSRTVDFQVINADTADRYFQGSLTDTGFGLKSITVTPDVVVPGTGTITFLVQYDRGMGAGVLNANTQIEFSVV